MKLFAATAAIISVLLAACASNQETLTVDEQRDALSRAILQLSRVELEEGYDGLTKVIRSPVFDQLDSGERYDALYLAGLVAFDLDHFTEAHALLMRSSVMPEATGDDWLSRLDAARALGNEQDAIHSLIQLARRFPDSLRDIDQIVWDTVRQARLVQDGEAALYELLNSLYSSEWKLTHGLEPSGLWRDLVALELNREQFARAGEVMGRIHAPQVVLSMRIDRRFDPLREKMPGSFDVDAAVASDLARMHAMVRNSPRSLDAIVQLTYSMLTARRYDDVLQTTAEVLRKIEGALAGQLPYDDVDRVIWIHDNRARALSALERWEEAESEMRTAAYMKEAGETNVSNVINLAWFYAEAGRSDEALSIFADLGEGMSPYGLMQMHGARYAAALHKGDLAIANESFAYIEKNRSDSLDMWQWTLVRANRIEEAAALLIERLQDPALSGRTLEELQEYQDPPPAAARAVWDARWTQIKNRPDVRRAVDAVGRIERVGITQPIG